MLKWEARVLYCMGSGGTEENIFSREWPSETESVSWGMSFVTKCCLKSSHIPVQHLLTQSWLGISVMVTDPSTWELLYMQLRKYLYFYTGL